MMFFNFYTIKLFVKMLKEAIYWFHKPIEVKHESGIGASVIGNEQRIENNMTDPMVRSWVNGLYCAGEHLCDNLLREKYEYADPGLTMDVENGKIAVSMVVYSKNPYFYTYAESDSFMFFLDKEDKVPNEDWVLFYNNHQAYVGTKTVGVSMCSAYIDEYYSCESVLCVDLSRVPKEIRIIRCYSCAYPHDKVYCNTEQSFVAFHYESEHLCKTILADMTKNRNSMIHDLLDKRDEWEEEYTDKTKVAREAYCEAAVNKGLLNGFGSVHFLDITRTEDGHWQIKIVCKPDDSIDGLIKRFFKD